MGTINIKILSKKIFCGRCIWKLLFVFAIGFVSCYLIFNSSTNSVIFLDSDREVASFRLRQDKLWLKSSSNKKSFDHLTIDCKPSTSWRFINEAISRLLESGFRFKSIRFKMAQDRFALYFPVDNLMNIEYGAWSDNRIKSLDRVRNPILPSYDTGSELITVGRLDEYGHIYHGFSGEPILRNNQIQIQKNQSLILFVEWNCELSQVILADEEIHNLGYKNIVFVGGSAPLQWPPFFIPRTLKELKMK